MSPHEAVWVKGESVPVDTEFHFVIGEDKRGKLHEILISIETGPDGTTGVRIRGLQAPLIFQPRSPNEAYITTLRP